MYIDIDIYAAGAKLCFVDLFFFIVESQSIHAFEFNWHLAFSGGKVRGEGRME